MRKEHLRVLSHICTARGFWVDSTVLDISTHITSHSRVDVPSHKHQKTCLGNQTPQTWATPGKKLDKRHQVRGDDHKTHLFWLMSSLSSSKYCLNPLSSPRLLYLPPRHPEVCSSVLGAPSEPLLEREAILSFLRSTFPSCLAFHP